MVKQRQSPGFSLMELMVVMLILALLVSIVPPMVNNSILKAKEAALRKDLSVVRKALDDYFSDTGKYPPTLQELVDSHYIRAIPKDPITDSGTTWQLEYNDNNEITDLHSDSTQESRDGSRYNEW